MLALGFGSDNVPQDIQDHIITHARLVVHSSGPVAFGSSILHNHWSIYLLHSTGCVRLNMVSTEFAGHFKGPQRGRLLIMSHGWTTVALSAIESWDFPAAANVKVRDVIELINNNGRWRYELNADGTGCRHWV